MEKIISIILILLLINLSCSDERKQDSIATRIPNNISPKNCQKMYNELIQLEHEQQSNIRRFEEFNLILENLKQRICWLTDGNLCPTYDMKENPPRTNKGFVSNGKLEYQIKKISSQIIQMSKNLDRLEENLKTTENDI